MSPRRCSGSSCTTSTLYRCRNPLAKPVQMTAKQLLRITECQESKVGHQQLHTPSDTSLAFARLSRQHRISAV
jgi:hypothetical protein